MQEVKLIMLFTLLAGIFLNRASKDIIIVFAHSLVDEHCERTKPMLINTFLFITFLALSIFFYFKISL